MDQEVIEISARGQITIPKKIRSILKGKFVTISILNNQIILTPVQTLDAFLNELDEAHQDWKKNGGISLTDLKSKYDL